MPPRPAWAPEHDFRTAREFEETVGSWLGDYKIGNLTDPDRLDWWLPGAFIDVKEKRQVLNGRWHMLPGVAEHDLFVVDELSVRRAMQHAPHSYFLIRDVPGGDRVFLARIDEMCAAERVRLNRVGRNDHRKGKWVVDLRNFRLLDDPPTQLVPTILNDQQHTPWKASHCVTLLPVPDV